MTTPTDTESAEAAAEADAEAADAAVKAAAEAEIRRLERETEGLKILKEQQDAENKRRMDELDTVSTGVPDRDESEPLEASEEVDATAQLREEIAGLTVDEPSDDDSDVDEAAMTAMERDLLDRMPPESFAALQAAWDEGREVSMEEFFAGLPPAPRDDAE